MSSGNNKFVFVVCGARPHIETLHFSLTALKRFSQTPVLVVTDAARNEIPVDFGDVIDIKTPQHFNHHQASIYLKTGLHRFLPGGFTYCYLDTDVIALNAGVDEIFNQHKTTITFANDHCTLQQFSPHAVNCGCAEKNKELHAELNALLQKGGFMAPEYSAWQLSKQKQLQQSLEILKRDKWQLLNKGIQYSFSVSRFRLNEDNYYNKAEKTWSDKSGEVFLYEVPVPVIKYVEKNSRWRWNKVKRRWISPDGSDIQLLACAHLQQALKNKFAVDVPDGWQHWNGGVFLFSDHSHNFMENWHQNTLQVFNDPYWKTRDQGSLIATVWQNDLRWSPPLSKKFNFIAYFYNPALMINETAGTISDNAFETMWQPSFIHVFEHFGDKTWGVWNWIEER